MFAAGSQLLTPSSGPCLVGYDATGTGIHAASTVGGVHAAHTIGASATALLVSASSAKGGDTYASVTSNSCLLGSTPMSLLGFVTNGNAASVGWCEVWGLVFAAGTFTGAQTITYNEVLTGTTYPDTVLGSVSYTNVASFGTAVTKFAVSATASALVASPVGDRVFAATTGGGSTLTLSVSGPGTQRWNPAGVSGYIQQLLQDIPGNTTVKPAVTLSSSTAWGMVAVNMVAA